MASFILPIVSGLAGLFGGGSSKTTNSSQQTQQGSQANTTQSGSYGTSGSTTPNLSPLQQALATMFTQGAQNLYNQSTDLTGYTQGGLQGINQSANNANQITSNILASKGLSSSPTAAFTQNQANLARVGQENQFTQGIPLLQRQLQTQALQGLTSAFGVLPTGVSTTGSGTSQGTSNTQGSGFSNTQGTSTTSTPGGWLSGLFGGLGAGLAGPGAGGNSNLTNILNTLGIGQSNSGGNVAPGWNE